VPVKSEQRKIQSGLDIKTFLSRLRLVEEVVFAVSRRHRQTRHVDGKYEGRFRNTLRRDRGGSAVTQVRAGLALAGASAGTRVTN
jgi:hypothetical protein